MKRLKVSVRIRFTREITFTLLNAVTMDGNALFLSLLKVADSSSEEFLRCFFDPLTDSSFHLLNISEVPSSQRFFEISEEMVIAGCEIRRICRMWKHCPSQLLDSLLCKRRCVRSSIVHLKKWS